MAAKIITPPAAEPVSLELAKAHMKVSNAVEDTLVELYVKAAREHCEAITGARFIHQTWELALDAFPDGAIELPGYPLSSVTSVEYLDENGDPQAVDAGLLVLDTFKRPGWVTCSEDWPATQDTINAVRVTYVVGFGAAADAVPSDIVNAILLAAGDLYENRQGRQKDALNENPAVDALLWPYRTLRP